MPKLMENKKGMALVTVLGFASVLMVLSTAFVARSFQETNLTRRYQNSMSALYDAEKGIAYAFVEAQKAGYNWATHEVDTLDKNGNGDITELIPLVGTSLTATATLPGSSINASGNYAVTTATGTIEVKAYVNPQSTSETILLCQATSGNNSRILKLNLSQRSMYHYLYYYPTGKVFSSVNFDGKNAGGIYVNGNIGLSYSTFSNLSEFSTNTSGKLYATSYSYSPPYSLDNNDGVMDGKAPVPPLSATNNFTWPYAYKTDNYGWWGYGGWVNSTLKNTGSHFQPPGTINGIKLPGYDGESLLSTGWNWDKYWGDNAGIGGAIGEVPVGEFYYYAEDGVTPITADATYWAAVLAKQGGNPASFDPSFWDGKVYNRSMGEEISVKYLDTDKQAADWQSWLDNKGLTDVVHDKNTGGYDLAILDIETNYSTLAKSNGLYIEDKGSGSYEVCLNGSCSTTSSLPSWIQEKEFFNGLRPQTQETWIPYGGG